MGIKFDSLVFGKYKVDRLYIKLDKKLTLKADKIVIPKNKSKFSFANIDKNFDELKYLFTFFDTIDLENIMFDNNHINLVFTNDKLYFTDNDFEVAGSIARTKEILHANISTLHLKKYNMTLNGDISYNLKEHTIKTEGEFNVHHIKGEFTLYEHKNTLTFKIKSERFKDLKMIVDTFDLNPSIKEWIVDKVQAKYYTLNNLEGSGKITSSGFQMDFDTLKGNMLFDDAKIYFQQNLDPILVKNIELKYMNSSLFFDLKKPRYKNRSLEGSKVKISRLGKTNTLLKLDLHMDTPLDNQLQKILKSYALDIPVKSNAKVANIDLNMDIPLGEWQKNIPLKVVVSVALNRGDVWYKKIKLPLEKGKVKFNSRENESLKVFATLKKGMVEINGVALPVLGGKMFYQKSLVTLENVHLKEKWYDAIVKGKIDLKNQKSDLNLDIKKIMIEAEKKFIVIKNKALALRLEYKKNLEVTVPSLALKITNRKDNLLIELEDIKKLKPYLKNMPIMLNGGKLQIVKKDKDTYFFKGELRSNVCFFYDKGNVCHTKIPCFGKTTKGKGFELYAFDERLYFNAKKSRIKLQNLNIDLKKFLEVQQKKQNTKKSKKLVILGKNSKIRYEKHTLITDSYDIEIATNGNIKALGSLDGDIVQFSKNAEKVTIKALRVKDKMLHPLISFNGLQGGRYTFKKSGNPNKTLKGQIIIEGGVMSNFKAYNNTLAFINAIPALATLNRPGFSKSGFKIQEGVIDYHMKGDRVVFDSIYLKGPSATIVGKGKLHLKNKTIQMKLAIQTARELGKLVGHVPLLGYILMGKDKSLTVGLTVSGTLYKPIVKTSAAKDILTLPLHIIRRTLESPAHLINK